jgi:Type I restriction modification DNA specificity domain
MKMIKISDLFEIQNGNGFELMNMDIVEKSDPNSCNFVSRTEKNSGISARVELSNTQPFPANTITVAVGGSVLSTFVQSEPYYTGYHIQILTPKKKYSDVEMMFYAFCIRQNKYRYSYGRQANKTLKDILIPEKLTTEWQELNSKNLNNLKAKPLIKKELELNVKEWSYFKYEEIFDTNLRGRRLTNENREKGTCLYFSASEFNNGLTDSIANPLFVEENAIIYSTFGDAYYIKSEFTASDEISIFKHTKLNRYNGLFIATIMLKNKYKYSFGRKAFRNKWVNDRIGLPINSKGEPDWQFMEDYIKSLPYSSSLA